jgi:hypothetical protein
MLRASGCPPGSSGCVRRCPPRGTGPRLHPLWISRQGKENTKYTCISRQGWKTASYQHPRQRDIDHAPTQTSMRPAHKERAKPRAVGVGKLRVGVENGREREREGGNRELCPPPTSRGLGCRGRLQLSVRHPWRRLRCCGTSLRAPCSTCTCACTSPSAATGGEGTLVGTGGRNARGTVLGTGWGRGAGGRQGGLR